MKRICKYRPERDRHAVDPLTAGLDLRQAYVNGSVPSNVYGADMSFNDVENPDGMMSSASDTFEAMRQADYVKSALSAAETESNAASSAD